MEAKEAGYVKLDIEGAKKKLIDPYLIEGTPSIEDIAEFVDSASEDGLETEPNFNAQSGEGAISNANTTEAKGRDYDRKPK